MFPKEINQGNVLKITNTLHEKIVLIAAYIDFPLRHISYIANRWRTGYFSILLKIVLVVSNIYQ